MTPTIFAKVRIYFKDGKNHLYSSYFNSQKDIEQTIKKKFVGVALYKIEHFELL